ncbi:MAG TPA: hypothetical protein VF733_05440 [Candidatus Saccharimonadales bacterium]
MSETVFAVLTNPAVRDAKKIRSKICSEFEAGIPWWTKGLK